MRTVGILVMIVGILAIQGGHANAAPTQVRCDDIATGDYSIDGLMDDWGKQPVLARVGVPSDGAIALRCAWDGTALAFVLDLADDSVVRTPNGRGHEDRVSIQIAAGGKPLAIDVKPGNPIAKPAIGAPAKVVVATSLQPKGFSIEGRVPAAVVPGFSGSTAALDLHVVFHDSDAATGGHEADLPLDVQVVLGDRADLLDDFLKTVKLKKSDVRVDVLAELDPDRKGKERLVAGGTVIGVITDKFAFVQMPAAKPADVLEVKLLPLGPRGQQIISARVRQSGNGGSRDLLMLWTVWSGQLTPLAQIELRKQLAGNILEAGYRIAPRGPELLVEPKPAIGFTADTWNEEPADDADAIVLPWDARRGGIGYTLKGAELVRRDLPKHR